MQIMSNYQYYLLYNPVEEKNYEHTCSFVYIHRPERATITFQTDEKKPQHGCSAEHR